MALNNLPEEFIYRELPAGLVDIDTRRVLASICGGVQDRLEDLRSFAGKFELFLDPLAELPETGANVIKAVYQDVSGKSITRSLEITDATPGPTESAQTLLTWAAGELGIEATSIVSAAYDVDPLRVVDIGVLQYLAASLGAVLYKSSTADPTDALNEQRRILAGYFPRLKIKGTAASFEILGRLMNFGDTAMTPLWSRLSARKPDDLGNTANETDFSAAPDQEPKQVIDAQYDPHNFRDSGVFYSWDSGSISNNPDSPLFYTNAINGRQPWIKVKTSVLQTISSILYNGTHATATCPLPHGLLEGDVVQVTGAEPSDFNGEFSVAAVPAGTTPYFSYNLASTPSATNASGDMAYFTRRVYHPLALPEGYSLGGGSPHVKANVTPTGNPFATSLQFEAIAEGDSFNGLKVIVENAGGIYRVKIEDQLSAIKYRSSYYNLAMTAEVDRFAELFGAPPVKRNSDLAADPSLTADGTAAVPYRPWKGNLPTRTQAISTDTQLDTAKLAEVGAQAAQYFEEVKAATRFPRSVSFGFMVSDAALFAAFGNRTELFTVSGAATYSGTATGFPLEPYTAAIVAEVPATTSLTRAYTGSVPFQTSPGECILEPSPIKPNSLSINSGEAVDDGSGNIIGGTFSGTINYQTGVMVLRSTSLDLSATADFSYNILLTGENVVDISGAIDYSTINFKTTGISGSYYFDYNSYSFVVTSLPTDTIVSARWVPTSTEVIRVEPGTISKNAGVVGFLARPEDEPDLTGQNDVADDFPWRRDLTLGGEKVDLGFYNPVVPDVSLTEFEPLVSVVADDGTEYGVIGSDNLISADVPVVKFSLAAKDLTAPPSQEAVVAVTGGAYHVGVVGEVVNGHGVLMADADRFRPLTQSMVAWLPCDQHPAGTVEVLDHSPAKLTAFTSSLTAAARKWDTTRGWVLELSGGQSVLAAKCPPHPAWSPAAYYSVGDRVSYLGRPYRAIKPTELQGLHQGMLRSIQPTNTTYWEATAMMAPTASDDFTLVVWLKCTAANTTNENFLVWGPTQPSSVAGQLKLAWTGTTISGSYSNAAIGSANLSNPANFYCLAIRKLGPTFTFKIDATSSDTTLEDFETPLDPTAAWLTLGFSNANGKMQVSDLMCFNAALDDATLLGLRTFTPVASAVLYSQSCFTTAGRKARWGFQVLSSGKVYPGALPQGVALDSLAEARRYDGQGRFWGQSRQKEIGLGGGQAPSGVWQLGSRLNTFVSHGTIVAAIDGYVPAGFNEVWGSALGSLGSHPGSFAAQPYTNPAHSSVWLSGDDGYMHEFYADDLGSGPELREHLDSRVTRRRTLAELSLNQPPPPHGTIVANQEYTELAATTISPGVTYRVAVGPITYDGLQYTTDELFVGTATATFTGEAGTAVVSTGPLLMAEQLTGARTLLRSTV